MDFWRFRDVGWVGIEGAFEVGWFMSLVVEEKVRCV